MGLFNFPSIKLDDLNGTEDAAVRAAMEVAINIGADKALDGKLSKAYRHYKKGRVTHDDLTVIIAAVAAAMDSLKGDSNDLRSTELEGMGIAVVAMALALNKLTKKL